MPFLVGVPKAITVTGQVARLHDVSRLPQVRYYVHRVILYFVFLPVQILDQVPDLNWYLSHAAKELNLIDS